MSEPVSEIVRKCFCCMKTIKRTTYCVDCVDCATFDATIWRSPGNWGSCVYDPIDDHFITMWICDNCLLQRKEMVYESRNEHRLECRVGF